MKTISFDLNNPKQSEAFAILMFNLKEQSVQFTVENNAAGIAFINFK